MDRPAGGGGILVSARGRLRPFRKIGGWSGDALGARNRVAALIRSARARYRSPLSLFVKARARNIKSGEVHIIFVHSHAVITGLGKSVLFSAL